jgi:NAD(P)-dependent dehydrogenase (short-subunit alcohol dehydrogenase family)
MLMSYSCMFRLEGRAAIVAGGARGIGYETVKAFQENGAKTVIEDISAELGEKAAQELGTDFFQADLTRSDQIAKVADEVRQKHGRIDIAFNNAGTAKNVPSEECSDENRLNFTSHRSARRGARSGSRDGFSRLRRKQFLYGEQLDGGQGYTCWWGIAALSAATGECGHNRCRTS